MRLTVLGSGTLVPQAERGPSGHLVEAVGESLLFDSGAGTLQRLARAGLDWRRISRVFYSHLHPDHSLDIVSLCFALNYAPGAPENKTLRVYGPAGLKEFFGKVRAAWPAVEPKRFALELVELAPGDTVEAEGCSLFAGKACHGGAIALAYRVESEGRSLVYTGDTEYCKQVVELVRGADMLLAECSTDEAHRVEGHLSPEGLARLLRESGARAGLIVHVYPPLDPEALAVECSRLAGVTVRAARDLENFEI